MNDRQLQYWWLPVDLFTDTLFSQQPSLQGNKCTEVLATENGWVQVYLLKKKLEAHDALSLLFQHEDVPNVMVIDGALAQVQGELRQKCRQAAIHVKQAEPHMPWSNSAESAIHELKRGLGCKVVQSGAPRSCSGIIVWRENCIFALTQPLISLVSMVKSQKLLSVVKPPIFPHLHYLIGTSG